MCGRFTLRVAASVVAEQFSLLEVPELQPRFNVAPSQQVAAVRIAPDEPRRELAWLRWGLVPRWAKDLAIGNRLINARAESAASKPAFRDAFRRRRCLVVADGFYEWQKVGPAKVGTAKQPYYVAMRDGRPFGIAGLWELWEGAEQESLQSCTILTTTANALMRPIHDRMPVIVPAEHYAAWLGETPAASGELAALLIPYASEAMRAYRVSARVNSPASEDPRCLEPVTASRPASKRPAQGQLELGLED